VRKTAQTRSQRPLPGVDPSPKRRLHDLRQIRLSACEEIPCPEIVSIGPEDDDVSPLGQLLSEADVVEVVDHFEEMLEELFYCRWPPLKREVQMRAPDAVARRDEFIRSHVGSRHAWAVGSWVYLPWRRTLLRLLPRELHQELRTARNRGWVEPDEQALFADLTVGIVGLSVGSSMALTLAQEGGARHMKLADFDLIAGSNLNRVRCTFPDLGLRKVMLVARQIYELDPFADLVLSPEGVSADNIETFFDESPALDALIDECDDPLIKIKLRLEAKKRRLPVLMATDMGDDVLLDIERYDLDPAYPIANGRIGHDLNRWLSGELTPQEKMQLIFLFLGPDAMPPKMLSIGQRLGTELDGPPQLGGTCAMAGGAVSHVLRRIFANKDPIAGRLRMTLASL